MARSASHKLQHSKLTVSSLLPAADLLALADEVAGAIVWVGMSGRGEPAMHVSKRTGTRHDYWVGRSKENGNNKTKLRLFAEAKPADGGRSVLRTGIAFFMTRQDTFLYVIPAGPKTLVQYPYYKRLMLNLEDAIRDRDPEATVEITERPA